MLATIQERRRKREKEREGDLSKARVSPSKRRRGTRSSISLLLDAISLLARRDDGSPSFSPSLPLTEAEISREADIPICVSGDVSTVVSVCVCVCLSVCLLSVCPSIFLCVVGQVLSGRLPFRDSILAAVPSLTPSPPASSHSVSHTFSGGVVGCDEELSYSSSLSVDPPDTPISCVNARSPSTSNPPR